MLSPRKYTFASVLTYNFSNVKLVSMPLEINTIQVIYISNNLLKDLALQINQCSRIEWDIVNYYVQQNIENKV